jgi:hypothetical protein
MIDCTIMNGNAILYFKISRKLGEGEPVRRNPTQHLRGKL